MLLALRQGAGHGYELGQRLERQSGGTWSPSAGSIYPNLQRLSDEGLVTSEERDGKRIYALTRSGIAELKDRASRGEAAPWEAMDGGGGELRDAVVALKLAAKQVSLVGTEVQRKRATEIVIEARRQLYELLANG
ncbi:Transcriptional regulator, PadR family [Labilithrix luteola]|uniref:Transcriptional regulator, PadR family n=1 Tax=Labilithrix luteola TaxID=1391654 RepID=A0A0K1PWG3_9BACT|nr:Transcriptional regulator, PadR family [Labilithrix luteola]